MSIWNRTPGIRRKTPREPVERTGEFYQREFPTVTQVLDTPAPGNGDRRQRRQDKRDIKAGRLTALEREMLAAKQAKERT